MTKGHHHGQGWYCPYRRIAMNHRDNPQLRKFVALFLEKNTHINLSAIRDEEGIWEKHIEDSLITMPLFDQFGEKKLKILDLGTGG